MKQEHPTGISVSGMFIVNCYRATKMSGTDGARVERPGSSEKYAEAPPASMENIPARPKYRLIYASYIYEQRQAGGLGDLRAGGWKICLGTDTLLSESLHEVQSP
ncbi:MAG: hypothetical protein KKA10_16820 [Euryarchaeota archaeon]|nr:hypothetical protein [Euryarchaeota archaeon]